MSDILTVEEIFALNLRTISLGHCFGFGKGFTPTNNHHHPTAGGHKLSIFLCCTHMVHLRFQALQIHPLFRGVKP